MPEQIFRAKALVGKSKKEKMLDIKLVNIRVDPEDEESMDIAHALAQKLTPQNVDIQREGFQLIHDDPRQDLGYSSLEQLAGRPAELSTDALQADPPNPDKSKLQAEVDRKQNTDTQFVRSDAKEAKDFEAEHKASTRPRKAGEAGGS